jgi:hypothetical protein
VKTAETVLALADLVEAGRMAPPAEPRKRRTPPPSPAIKGAER